MLNSRLSIIPCHFVRITIVFSCAHWILVCVDNVRAGCVNIVSKIGYYRRNIFYRFPSISTLISTVALALSLKQIMTEFLGICFQIYFRGAFGTVFLQCVSVFVCVSFISSPSRVNIYWVRLKFFPLTFGQQLSEWVFSTNTVLSRLLGFFSHNRLFNMTLFNVPHCAIFGHMRVNAFLG